MSAPTLEAVNLTKRYNGFTALSNLNLRIEGSKCVGFLGPNGAGKTTTLKLFTALISPSEGRALINDVDVRKDKKRALAPCGVLIETPEIYPALTPNEALSLIAETRGIPKVERKGKIGEALSDVKMEEWADKRVGKFSKGMKQRVDVAAALLGDPEILLLDEPSTGLDPRGVAEVRDIIRSLKKKEKLIFMSSHLLPEVSDVCDEVAMIDHGKLLVYDKLANVLARTDGGANVVEIGLSRPADNANIRTKILSVPGVVTAEKLDERSMRIEFKGGDAVQEELLSELAAMKIGMLSFQKKTSSLEETYLNMIKDSR